MLTAKTCCTSVCAQCVTDEQIRELRDWCRRDRPKAMNVADYYIYQDCKIALGEDPVAAIKGAQGRARSRIAAYLNARSCELRSAGKL